MEFTGAHTVTYNENGTNFNKYSSQYMCCCNNVHVKTGTMIMAIIAVMGLLLNFFTLFIDRSVDFILFNDIVFPIICLAALICLFYALHTQRAVFLIPYIGLQYCEIILVSVVIFLCICGLAGAEYPKVVLKGVMAQNAIKYDMKALLCVVLIVFALECFLTIWYLRVVTKCYTFFRQQERYVIGHGSKRGSNIYVHPITSNSPI